MSRPTGIDWGTTGIPALWYKGGILSPYRYCGRSRARRLRVAFTKRASAWWVSSLPGPGRHEPLSAPIGRIKRQMGPPSPSARPGRVPPRSEICGYPRQASRRTLRSLGELTDAVITVPAYSIDAALRRLQDAGVIAGPTVQRIASTSPRQPRLPTGGHLRMGEQGRHGLDLGAAAPSTSRCPPSTAA